MALISPLLLELNNRYEKGVIRDEHLQAFLERPDAVLTNPEASPTKKLVGLLPSGAKIFDLSLADSKPLYVAQHGNSNRVVWGKQQFRSHDCSEGFISLNGILNGKPLYQTQEQCFVWGEDELRHGEEPISGFYTIKEGKPLYTMYKEDGREFVVWGQKEFKSYEEIYSLTISDGKPLYVVLGRDGHFIVWGEEEFELKGSVFDPVSRVDGKFLYSHERDENSSGEGFACVVWGDKEFKTYSEILGSPRIVQEKPLYIVSGYDADFVVWGEQEFLGHKAVKELMFAEGRPLYVGNSGGKDMVVWGYDVLKQHEKITNLACADGKPLYVVHEKGKVFVVWGDRQFQPFDEIFSLTVTDDEVFYGARKGRRVFRVAMPRES